MSDTTWDECKCCRHDTDCIEGLCIECREYNYKLQKQVDLLTLGLLEEKRKHPLPNCKTCNDTGVYEHTAVNGMVLPVKCFHGSIKYPDVKAPMVKESIFSSKNLTIPLADVQHVEHWGTEGVGKYLMVITKHTKYNFEHDTWENAICVNEVEKFMRAWMTYRHELEIETLADLSPDGHN